LAFFWSFFAFSQATINVSYGSSPTVSVSNGGSVAFGLSGEITFSVTNIPSSGNPTLNIHSISSNSSNFIVSSSPFISDDKIKKNEVGTFKIRRGSYSCGSGSAVITIDSNVGVFTFTVSFDNAPSISVRGGTPPQEIASGQLVPTSTTGTLFGTVDVNASTTRTYIINNTGTCPLTIGALTIWDYDPATGNTSATPINFYINTSPSSTIYPGAASSFVVGFTPIDVGVKWALITIPSNDVTKPSYTFVVKGEGYNPTITGPGGGNADFRLWLKATRGVNLGTGTKVPLWKDLGSLGKDASQTIVVNQPTFVDAAVGNINYNPVVKFENNGSLSQYLYNIENGYYTHETFIVMEPDGTYGPMTIISGTSAASSSVPYPLVAGEHTGIGLGDFSTRLTGEKLWFNQWQTTTTTPYFSVADDNLSGFRDYTKAGIINTRNKTSAASAGVDLLFNSNNIGGLTSSNTTYSNLGYSDTSITPNIWKGTPYNIGKNINSGSTQGNLNGRVAEVLSYASRVLDGNRPKIETYLAIKYGITLGINGTSKNYQNSNGDIIWNIASNIGFNFNIAGIGRDVASDLYQKQSKSSNDSNEVTIGLGEIALTNSGNINQFAIDRNFLVWGSDNGTYTVSGSNTTTIRSGLATSTTRINKKWKVVETGGDVENVFVGVPETTFSSFLKLDTEEYVLIVSETATFNDTDIVDVIPLKSDGNGNLQTWYDFDGIKYFTFGKAPRIISKESVDIKAGAFLVGEYALNLNSGSFTIGCWLRNTGSGIRTIMGKGVNLEMRLNAANKIEAYWDGALRFSSNTAISDGKWHNVVAVYYLGSADIYIDGVLDASTFNLRNPSPNFSRYSVGALYVNKSDIRTPFLGEIDEIHIWDIGLSSSQINYLMNQEIEKHTDNTANGKVIPQSTFKNEVKTIPWGTLKAYYDFNNFYGTTVEGLTDDRNFLRIKYLDKNKDITATQTAPLPYETIADGAWSQSATWKNGAIQTLPNALSIINNTKSVNGNIVKIAHNVESTGNIMLLGLIVDGTNSTTYKALSVNNDTKIEISHYLKLDGLIDLTGRSQLVQTLDSELDAASKGFIKRDQQGTVNKFNYNYWSSPVGPINTGINNSNYKVIDVFQDGSTSTPVKINWIAGYNGNTTSPLSLARYWLYKFHNGTQYANWKRFNENETLLPSQGFTAKGAGSVPLPEDPPNKQNYTFVGKPYNGRIDGIFVKPENLFLVGNPYPSSLDAYKFIRDNIKPNIIPDTGENIGGYNTEDVIGGTLYFWQHAPDNNTHVLAGYTGGYATLTLVGSVAPVAPIGIAGITDDTNKLAYQYIPVGQGFFVNGVESSAGPLAIVFNNNQRAFVKEDAEDDTNAPISNTLFKNNAVKNKAVDHFNDNSNDVVYSDYYTKIRLGFNTNNQYHRQLLIGFMGQNATDSLDVGYDGYQLDTKASDLYFLVKDGKFNIQGVGAFDVTKAYPLGVKTDTIGVVKFMIDDTEFLPLNQKIYIHDKTDSIFYDITKNAVEVNLAAGSHNSRFELTFKTDQPEVIEETELPESMVLIYNNKLKNQLNITKNQEVTVNEVSVYNIIGQLISNVKEVANLNTIEVPFNVQKGAYIVKVYTDKGTVSKKVLKY